MIHGIQINMRAVIGLALLMSLSFLLATPTPRALAYGPCPGSSSTHKWAQGETTNLNRWAGVSGHLWTYQPAVPNIAQQFSLSHLMMVNQQSPNSPFVEVGWYKGQGTQNVTVATEWTGARTTAGIYTEVPIRTAPPNTTVNYQLKRGPFDYGTNSWMWYAIINGFTDFTWYNTVPASGIVYSGGEVAVSPGGSLSGVQMQAQMYPYHLLLQMGTPNWREWTPATMSSFSDSTFICDDNPYAITYTDLYMRYSITGTG